jgi:hypothetical protein
MSNNSAKKSSGKPAENLLLPSAAAALTTCLNF